MRVAVILMALLVPVSYVIGFARIDADALWGGVVGGGRVANYPFMLLAAVSFVAFVAMTFQRPMDHLHWPRQAPDGRGQRRLLAAYSVYLVPSALWLESTILHLRFAEWWTQALVILVLGLVGTGVVMFGLLAWSDPHRRWLMAAVIGMGIQSILNDLIIWVAVFPW